MAISIWRSGTVQTPIEMAAKMSAFSFFRALLSEITGVTPHLAEELDRDKRARQGHQSPRMSHNVEGRASNTADPELRPLAPHDEIII